MAPSPCFKWLLFYIEINIFLGDRTTTEYRRYYNEETPFHRNTKLFKLRNL